MNFYFLRCSMLLALVIVGCGVDDHGEEDHDHDVPDHLPTSLADLCHMTRERLDVLESQPENVVAKQELADLVAWAPEFAADTPMQERRWIPIYEASEALRLQILDAPEDWDLQRRDQTTRLCQIAMDAWRSLPTDKQIDRVMGHYHDDHEHDHDEHSDHEEEDDA